jgi:Xaa-Pro aminopeptidase
MPVLIDAGAMVDGYCSDMTRTVWFKGNEAEGDTLVEPSESFLKVEQVVKDSYEAAIKHLRKQRHITAANLDASARDYMHSQNLGQYFIHTLGHGVGLEIHENPSVGSTDQTPLVPGMAITIEPGLYLPSGTLPNQSQAIGYRFENTCLITNTDVVELT